MNISLSLCFIISIIVYLYILLVFILFIVLVSGYEWARLSGIDDKVLRACFAVSVTLVPWAILEFASSYALWSIYVAVLWWFSISFYLKIAKPKNADASLKWDKLFIAFVILPAAALAMQKIHSLQIGYDKQGPAWLFYALALVWVADIGAYFAGKKFGKNKLAPHISPGKTKEGLLGGVVATSVYTLIASYYFKLDTDKAILLVMLSVIVTFISVSGDLYMSFLKREAGLKDSGNILPGHGGMLDRIDSVLAAMPVFLIGFNWWIYKDIL